MIFVVGSSRSGTTMTGRILGMNSAVFTFDELHFFEQVWQENDRDAVMSRKDAQDILVYLFSTQRDGYFFRHQNSKYQIEADTLIDQSGLKDGTHRKHEVFALFAQYEADLNSKARWCEQTPRNVYYIDTINSLFPQARFVHIIRDPRDVLLSQKKRWKRRKFNTKVKLPFHITIRQWLNYHPITIMKLWVSANRKISSYSGKPFFYSVKYEDLLSQPEETLRGMCDFLNISFEPQMLEVPQVGSSLKADEPGKKGLNSSKIFGWKTGGLSKSEIYICERMGGDIISAQGYDFSNISPGGMVLFHYLSFPIKLALALPFSLNRIKNLRESIRRRL